MSFKTLLAFLSLVACSACGQSSPVQSSQAGPEIKATAVSDLESLFTTIDLMERAYMVAAKDLSNVIEGKIQMMLNACDKAKQIDTKDPYATYEAAQALAKAYDIVALAIEGLK